jgi:hypothetical protein
LPDLARLREQFVPDATSIPEVVVAMASLSIYNELVSVVPFVASAYEPVLTEAWGLEVMPEACALEVAAWASPSRSLRPASSF